MLSRATVPPFYNKVKLAMSATFPYVMANKPIAALEEEAVLGGSMSLVKREQWGLGQGRETTGELTP